MNLLAYKPSEPERNGALESAVFGEFGQRLHVFARVLTDDPALADLLVIQSIRAHGSSLSSLRELATGVYIAWLACDGPSRPSRTASTPDASSSEQLFHQIHCLSPDQRAALALCRYAGRSLVDTAEVLEQQPGDVAQLLCDALRALALPRVDDLHSVPAA